MGILQRTAGKPMRRQRGNRPYELAVLTRALQPIERRKRGLAIDSGDVKGSVAFRDPNGNSAGTQAANWVMCSAKTSCVRTKSSPAASFSIANSRTVASN